MSTGDGILLCGILWFIIQSEYFIVYLIDRRKKHPTDDVAKLKQSIIDGSIWEEHP